MWECNSYFTCTVHMSTCRLPFDDYWVYVIIGGGAALILLVTIVCLTCVLCCCCCQRRKRKKHRLVNSDSILRHNPDDGHGTMSASFKLVPQSNTVNRWRRSDRKVSHEEHCRQQSITQCLSTLVTLDQLGLVHGSIALTKTSIESKLLIAL